MSNLPAAPPLAPLLALALACSAAPAGAAGPPEPLKVDLSDPGPFFSGPGADPVNANCTACHSAEMILTQPPLTKAAWQGEIAKMIKVYKAEVAEEDVPAIIDYLSALNPPPPDR